MFLILAYSSRTSDSPPSPSCLQKISGCLQSMLHPCAQENSTQVSTVPFFCCPSHLFQDTMFAATSCCLQAGASMCENFIRICYKVGHLLVSPTPLGAYSMLLVARIFGETIFKGLFKKQNKINKQKIPQFPIGLI